jgi:anti-sigma factor RsiW
MTDQGLDTIVAGVRCRDVLAALSDLVDGELGAERVHALQAHLAQCDRCARFGGEVMRLLTALRAMPAPEGAGAVADAVMARIGSGSR